MRDFLQRFTYLHEIIKIDQEANEKKFLKVAIEKLTDNEYITWTFWGRIGSTGQAPQQIYRGNDLKKAYKAASKKLEEKYSGGYVDPWHFMSIVPTGESGSEHNPNKTPTSPHPTTMAKYKDFFEQHVKPREIAKKQHVAFSSVIEDFLLWLSPDTYAEHREYIDTLKPPSDICQEIIRLLEVHHGQVEAVNKHLGYRYPYFSIEILKHIQQWNSPATPTPTDQITALKAELKTYRLETSRTEKVAPYVIFTDKELDSLIELKPTTKEELLKVRGFADRKVAKYGEDILRILNAPSTK